MSLLKISAEQRLRVDHVLYECEDIEARINAIRELDSEELHVYAYEYNWDDGVALLDAVVRHPFCDKGTALMIFWTGEPEAQIGETLAQSESAVGYDYPAFLDSVAKLLIANNFASNRIRFDPNARLNVVQIWKLERNTTIPDILKRPNC